MVFVGQQMSEEAKKMSKINPDEFHKPQMAIERKTSSLELLDEPQKTNGNTWHLKFNISYSTNDNMQVELWLDEKTQLPIKRVFFPDNNGPPVIENYSFKLNPKTHPDQFDPMQIDKDKDARIEIFFRDAEKPISRLLKSIWEGDSGQFYSALKAGADPNGTTSFVPNPLCGFTPLKLASQCDRTNLVEELIKRGAK